MYTLCRYYSAIHTDMSQIDSKLILLYYFKPSCYSFFSIENSFFEKWEFFQRRQVFFWKWELANEICSCYDGECPLPRQQEKLR